jgi:hypothetical protein
MEAEDVRLAVYSSFARRGFAPRSAELADILDLPVAEVHRFLAELAQARHVVLGTDHEVLMAHPFSSVPLGFSVMGAQTLWWGGCAWDSFALPHLLLGEPDVLVATRCPSCATAHAWSVGRDAPPPGDQVAHFLTPVARMWDDVVHTCSHQRIFCSESCVDAWVASSGVERGYVMDLATLWRLASGWYAGRLERGYVRREPAASAAYLRSVGLSGPFWGLPDEPS